MSTIHFNETTTSTPEQFVAALTDFGPGRSEIFGNSADEYLEVHDQGPTEADVTEGSRVKVYVWPDAPPQTFESVVVMTTRSGSDQS